MAKNKKKKQPNNKRNGPVFNTYKTGYNNFDGERLLEEYSDVFEDVLNRAMEHEREKKETQKRQQDRARKKNGDRE